VLGKSLALVGLMASVGCGSARPGPGSAPHPHPHKPEPKLAPSELGDTGWGDVESRRQSVVVRLPVRAAWRVEDDKEQWFLARHEATGSELRVRTWVAPRQVRAEECQAQARLWRPSIPPVDDESVVRRRLRAPDDFFGEVVVGVSPGETGLEGHALAFGASVGRCYAAVFTTRVSGAGSEEALGRRLVLIVDGVLGRVRMLGVEDRANAAREHRP
jgi:hypothetical protein